MIILFFPPLSNHKIQSSAVSPHLLKSSQVCKRLAGLKVSTLVQRSFELPHCQVKSAVLVSVKKYAVVITYIVKIIELGCYCFKCNAILYSMTCHLNKFTSSIHFMWSIYDAVSDLMHNWVAQRPDFKSALRVVKMVLNTQCYQYLWLTIWFHAKKSKETLKNSKSLILQC